MSWDRMRFHEVPDFEPNPFNPRIASAAVNVLVLPAAPYNIAPKDPANLKTYLIVFDLAYLAVSSKFAQVPKIEPNYHLLGVLPWSSGLGGW